MKQTNGFTLVEILIALAIMATIAVLTIPKVLDTAGANSDNEKWQRIVKQNAGQMAAAYNQYRANNRTVPDSFTMTDLTPFLNYVTYDSTSLIDGTPCWGSPISCGASYANCYKMSNGSMLYFDDGYFDGSGTLNVLNFMTDPDGKVTGPAGQHPGKGVGIWMYYNGRTKTRAQIDTGSVNSGGTYNPNASCDPNWWSWS